MRRLGKSYSFHSLDVGNESIDGMCVLQIGRFGSDEETRQSKAKEGYLSFSLTLSFSPSGVLQLTLGSNP